MSTYHFLGVSLDRFFAIKMPMAYRQSPQLNLNQCFQVLSPCSHSKAEVLVEIIKFIFWSLGMLSFYDISVAQHLCCFAKIDFPIDLSQRTSTKEQDHPPPSGCVLAAGVDRGDPHVARSGQPLSGRGGSEQVHLQISLSICKLSILKN